MLVWLRVKAVFLSYIGRQTHELERDINKCFLNVG